MTPFSVAYFCINKILQKMKLLYEYIHPLVLGGSRFKTNQRKFLSHRMKLTHTTHCHKKLWRLVD